MLLRSPSPQLLLSKVLRPNPTAEYELRVGDLRPLYDVAGTTVVTKVVGRKVGNHLVVKAEAIDG